MGIVKVLVKVFFIIIILFNIPKLDNIYLTLLLYVFLFSFFCVVEYVFNRDFSFNLVYSVATLSLLILVFRDVVYLNDIKVLLYSFISGLYCVIVIVKNFIHFKYGKFLLVVKEDAFVAVKNAVYFLIAFACISPFISAGFSSQLRVVVYSLGVSLILLSVPLLFKNKN
ncbi:hypothetical protein [Rheinheimera pacifica]|uniref:hypothetical protein n=1 Tax=Rheinheimera pacifica TaxID=173990 RepID=UPI002EDA13DB